MLSEKPMSSMKPNVPTSEMGTAIIGTSDARQLCKDTVLDEVAFGLELTGVGAAEARERARSVAGRFGLPLDAAGWVGTFFTKD